MPNTNALLLVGLGLAALTMFRREESDMDEAELVNASMLASGTGETGKALDVIPSIGADVPIGGPTPEAQPMADPLSWLQDLFAGVTPGPPAPRNGTGVASSNKDTELPNNPVGAEPVVTVSPFVQTPTYIRTTGDQVGQALRQIGIITDPGDVDLLNPKIYVQEIETEEFSFGPLTRTEDVQIVAGGANPGDPYYTTLDVLAAYRDMGGFGPVTYAHEVNSVSVPNEEVAISARDQEPTLNATLARAMLKRDRLHVAAPDEYATGLSPVPAFRSTTDTGYATGLDWI